MNIFKYALKINYQNIIEMPIGAKCLCVKLQNDEPMIWAIVNESSEKEEHFFEFLATGQQFENDCSSRREYIGTIQLNNGLVFHLFEIIKYKPRL